MEVKRPTMYLLVGPNGAGKTTFYETTLEPRIKAPFINADIIQKDELKDSSMSAAYKAASIAAERRNQYLITKQSFVSETTFSHPSKLKLIEDAKAQGFRILVFQIGVGSDELAVARVVSRVERGGHNVPEEKIRARFKRNQALIRQAVLKADKAFIYDNSRVLRPAQLVMSFSLGRVDRVATKIPSWVQSLYTKELKLFESSD